jgi:hypothetical protein
VTAAAILMGTAEEIDERSWRAAQQVLPAVAWHTVEGAIVGKAAPRGGRTTTVHYIRDGERFYLLAADVGMPPAEAVRRARGGKP